MKKANLLCGALASALLLAGAASAHADLVPLTVFENQGGVDVSNVHLAVDVTEAAGVAKFDFLNTSTVPAVVTLITFEKGFDAFLNFSSLTLTPGTGVAFVKDASAKVLPGGSNIGFDTLISLSRKNQGGLANGINPGEHLLVSINFLAGKSLSDILVNGELTPRIGEHVQGLGTGGQYSVAAVTTSVPEPASAGVMMTGLAGLIAARRRRAVK